MFDVLIRGGEIIDGRRSRRFRGDVGIQGEQIVAIGDLRDVEAGVVLDATGKIVAPGFVDVHNHSDAWLRKIPHLTSKTMQGFTTEVIMADGISYAPLSPSNAREWITYLRALNGLRFEEYSGWLSIEEYMAGLDRKNVQNSIPHVPYANVRALAAGWGRAAPDDYQMRQIIAEVQKGMDAGAVGLSTGMDYIAQWFATTQELADACAPLVEKQGLYVTHMRYKRGTMPALKEAVEIGKRAGVPVHISHLKGVSPEASEEILSYIDKVARNEVSFSFDVYPYLPGSTMLNYWLPYEVYEQGPLGVLAHLKRQDVRAQMEENLRHVELDKTHIAWVPGKENSDHQGKWLSDYVAEVGKTPGEALCDLLIEENLGVLLVMHLADDELIAPFLGHDCYMMGSDGIFHVDGVVHPRQYGSAARLLGPAVRKGWLTLEDAVFKLSGHPADRFGLIERGQIREGWWADIVVFDAETIEDRATYEKPHQFAVGVEQVLVNGIRVIADGKPVAELPDRLPGRAALQTKVRRSMRQAKVERSTRESTIFVSLDVDGAGKAQIDTGIGFLDHMLTLLCGHGLFDLEVQATGDLQIDEHHTAEDTMICLGKAFDQALGERRGLVRTAHSYVPMDESLALVAVDLSGRPYCVFQADFATPRLGGLGTDLIFHLFESFAIHARMNLHAQVLYGRNDHHKVEALFKALARALDAATQLDARREDVPSTKGTLTA